ncbi:MAG: DNA-binding MurR/RpiR family transcriptional regulator [bacterium]|jgi:DNA-binding MurR/RpiR family transcriptional regulator
MTMAEHKLATTLLSDYPFAGLDSIQSFSSRSKVSPPSVTRFVQKLGCKGYLDFQRCLISELREDQRSPAELQLSEEKIHSDQAQTLSQFISNASQLLKQLPSAAIESRFAHLCNLLSDESRSIFFLGGHMSDPVLQMLSRHLRRSRRHVFHLNSDPESWPDVLLRMGRKDIFLTMDVRRYQQSLYDLAKLVAIDRKSRVVLFTDRWMSPVSEYSKDVFPLPIENGSAWDSYLCAIAFCEAIIKRVGDGNQSKTRRRLKEWDSLRPELMKS